MLTVILGILTFFVVLACLVLIHELGHFSTAKLLGVRVEEFGLGFPPRLKKWQWGGTIYSLNALPIGGFVKMLGENGQQAQPDSFGAQAPWKRFVILVAGPAMNVLLALIIFFLVQVGGYSRQLSIITGVQANSPAAAAGLRPNDRILSINGSPVRYLDDVQIVTLDHLGESVQLRVRRGPATFTTSLIPRLHPPDGQGPIGILMAKSVIFSQPPRKAAATAVQDIGATALAIPMIFHDLSQHRNHVSGPIGIAQQTTITVQNEPQVGIAWLFLLIGALSASLGVLNLLPIPALDGGRIVFVLLSWARRKNVDPELEGLIHMMGMAVLLTLIVLISYQDVARIVSGGSF